MSNLMTRKGLFKALVVYVVVSTIAWYGAAIIDRQAFVNDMASLTKDFLAVVAEVPYLRESWVSQLDEWRRNIPGYIEVMGNDDESGLNKVWKVWMVTAVATWLLLTVLIVPFLNWALERGTSTRPERAAAPAGNGGGGGNTYNRPATNEFDVEVIWAKYKGLMLFISFILLMLLISFYTVVPKGFMIWLDPESRTQIGPSWFDPMSTGIGAIMLLVVVLGIPLYIGPKIAHSVMVHEGGAWTDKHTGIMVGMIFGILAIEYIVLNSVGLL